MNFNKLLDFYSYICYTTNIGKTMLTKNEKIRQTLRATRAKRITQKCSVFSFKIDLSKLNKLETNTLKMFFVENKRLYNYLLSLDDISSFDTKTRNIIYKDKDKKDISYTLTMPAKMIQTNFRSLQQSLRSLHGLKSKHRKVGKLKFKSEYNSIELNQYGLTHEIKSKNRIKITGIKRPLKVFGLEQLKTNINYEFANARLVKKPSGYYIALTCFENLDVTRTSQKPVKEVGIDFGIKTNLTTSDGEKFNICVGESVRLKSLQKKLSRQIKGTNNRYKTLLKIRKEYEKLTNKKKDKANKIINYLGVNYSKIYIQDELIKNWHAGLFGKQVQHSCLGFIKAKLKRMNNVVVIPASVPTTKLCYKCGKYHDEITLKDRKFVCSCGLTEDRDIKAAKTILFVGQCNNTYIPREPRITPAERKVPQRNRKLTTFSRG